jgi:Flp pilus assembly protein TadG
MRRLEEDGGAVSLIIALCLMAVFGFAAIVIDFGRMYEENRQLQNAADAGALAVAQECAANAATCNEAARTPTAATLANANSRDSLSDAVVQIPGVNGANSVTVTATSRTGDGAFITNILGGMFGVPTSTMERQATASWGGPIGEGATVPLTFSACEWDQMTGGLGVGGLPTPITTVYHHTSSNPSLLNSCSGPAGQDYPGGFGWLDPDGSGTCTAQVVAGTVGGDTGNGPPTPAASTGCTNAFFQGLLGQTILMPIYGTVSGTGSNAVYEVLGFAAMELTGYRIGGSQTGGTVPCDNPLRCFSGRFVAYYDLGSQPSPSTPNYGAVVVGLTG